MTPSSSPAPTAAFDGRSSRQDHGPKPGIFLLHSVASWPAFIPLGLPRHHRLAAKSLTAGRSSPSLVPHLIPVAFFSTPRFPVVGGGSWCKGTSSIIPITEG
ncbi:hypothetical protein NL676_038560 [Syzygium grande]|nr:hypothetical protein NL676_038560 [Syzygium grande]